MGSAKDATEVLDEMTSEKHLTLNEALDRDPKLLEHKDYVSLVLGLREERVLFNKAQDRKISRKAGVTDDGDDNE